MRDHLKEGSRVLDVGSGSGYLTACIAHMVCWMDGLIKFMYVWIDELMDSKRVVDHLTIDRCTTYITICTCSIFLFLGRWDRLCYRYWTY